MSSDKEYLKELLDRASTPGAAPLTAGEKQWLKDFHARYPFFTIPGDDSDGEPSLRDVVTAPSPEALMRLRGDKDASRFDDFYPEAAATPTPSTNAAIDDFLNTYGHQSAEEDMLLEKLIFNPIPDYSQQLAAQEAEDLPPASALDAPGDSQDDRLNRFILTHRPGSAVLPAGEGEANPAASSAAAASAPTPAPAASSLRDSRDSREPRDAREAREPRENREPRATPPDGLLSESLAKIYVKTGRYSQAYEILNGLSLRFPEKSAYFADQLRFLRKLILNQQRRDAENQNKINSNP